MKWFGMLILSVDFAKRVVLNDSVWSALLLQYDFY